MIEIEEIESVGFRKFLTYPLLSSDNVNKTKLTDLQARHTRRSALSLESFMEDTRVGCRKHFGRYPPVN
jgi:hypothetical protein